MSISDREACRNVSEANWRKRNIKKKETFAKLFHPMCRQKNIRDREACRTGSGMWKKRGISDREACGVDLGHVETAEHQWHRILQYYVETEDTVLCII